MGSVNFLKVVGKLVVRTWHLAKLAYKLIESGTHRYFRRSDCGYGLSVSLDHERLSLVPCSAQHL